MELTKQDSRMAHGIAIIGMVMLHLFCRKGDLPYTPLLWIGDTPLIYYFGLLGEICVPIYLFCSGYAQALLYETEGKNYVRMSWVRIMKFLLNYWLVLLLVCVTGALFDKTGSIPNSIAEFFENFFLFRFSYNGIWWFVLTYVLLVVLSPLLLWVIRHIHVLLLVFFCGLVYIVAFYITRFVTENSDYNLLWWIFRQLRLLGTSQFSFIIGAVFYQYKYMSRLRGKKLAHKNVLCIGLMLLSVFGMCIVENGVIAPVVGLTILCCFHVMKKPRIIVNILECFGGVSTNTWLIHAFFYARIFQGLVFRAKYPLLITLFMFALCFAASLLIDIVYKPLSKQLTKWGKNLLV